MQPHLAFTRLQVVPANVIDRAFESDDDSLCVGTYSDEVSNEAVESEEVEEGEDLDEVGTRGWTKLSAKESRVSYTEAKAKFSGTAAQWAVSEERNREMLKMPECELRRRRVST